MFGTFLAKIETLTVDGDIFRPNRNIHDGMLFDHIVKPAMPSMFKIEIHFLFDSTYCCIRGIVAMPTTAIAGFCYTKRGADIREHDDDERSWLPFYFGPCSWCVRAKRPCSRGGGKNTGTRVTAADVAARQEQGITFTTCRLGTACRRMHAPVYVGTRCASCVGGKKDDGDDNPHKKTDAKIHPSC